MDDRASTRFSQSERSSRFNRSTAGGIAILCAIVGAAWIVGGHTGISPLVLALVIAAVWANTAPNADRNLGIVARAATLPLRIGIVLLGFRLSASAVVEVGIPGLVVVAASVSTALIGGMLLGRLMGLSRPVSLLTTVGFAICGQSAVAAAAPLSDADEEEIGYAVGLVALFGALALFVLPLINQFLQFDAEAYGALVGASVHDTSQVIATASIGGALALKVATIVKLTRVLALGPVLMWVSVTSGGSHGRPTLRQALPWYVVGFVIAVVLSSLNVLPEQVRGGVRFAEGLALTIAMAGVGASIQFKSLANLGSRPLVMAAGLWAAILTVAAFTTWAVGF